MPRSFQPMFSVQENDWKACCKLLPDAIFQPMFSVQENDWKACCKLLPDAIFQPMFSVQENDIFMRSVGRTDNYFNPCSLYKRTTWSSILTLKVINISTHVLCTRERRDLTGYDCPICKFQPMFSVQENDRREGSLHIRQSHFNPCSLYKRTTAKINKIN